MSSTTRAEQLANQLETVSNDLIATLEGSTDEQVRLITEREQWPVAVVGHHLAVSYAGFADLLAAQVAGESVRPEIAMDQIHEGNAQHAREYANVSKAETLEKLQANSATFLQQIRNLDDQQLDRTAGVFGGSELTVQQLIEIVGIHHTADHLESIRETIGG